MMEGQIIIGIAGFGGNGKSSVAEYFIQNHGFKRVSFADPIRKMLMAIGVEEEVLRDPVRKLQPHPRLMGRTPVYAMETLGSKWGRDLIHPEMWINHLMNDVQDKPLLINDDLRFQNEVDAFEYMGGRRYRLVVPGKQPSRPTDFKVQELTKVIDITNVIGVTKIKTIYEYIYQHAFGSISEDVTFDEFVRSRAK